MTQVFGSEATWRLDSSVDRAAVDRGPGGSARSKPYKGPESYAVEDAHLFFGRDRDAESVLATVLSSRFTLLHAPSGAGKSSLLNARIIPGLESRSWLPIRVTPGDDPTAAVRQAAIDQLLPPPEAEVFTITAAADQLGVPSSATLGELLAAYRDLELRDDLRRQLSSPVRASLDSESGGVYSGAVTPFFVRLLRGSIDVRAFAEHVAALTAGESSPAAVTSATHIGTLVDALDAPRVRAEFHALVRGLATFPIFGLRPFFEELRDVWGARHSIYSIVLVLDQFEELFTRFVDAGASTDPSSTLLDWRLRKEFFNEIDRLLGGRNDGGPPLPMRCVVSMRNEFIAQLDDLRRIAPDLGDSTIHLSFLRRDDAREAILQPAQDFGYTYDARLFDDVLATLTREGAYVEPAQLQIVCEKLWTERGATLAGARANGALPEVDFETYEALGGTRGILAGFFREYLDSLSDADRLEALEMLEPLITSSGTRNIAEWRQVVDAPFRDRTRREQLLYEMAKQTIVRFEARLGGRLVEVTHEFLIAPIRQALAEEMNRSPANVGFRQTLRGLETYRYQDFRSDLTKLLPATSVSILHENRERIAWTLWATELMLRSVVALRSEPALIQEWMHRYDSAAMAVPDAERIAVALSMSASSGHPLSRDELRLALDHADQLALSKQETQIVLQSMLRHGSPSDAPKVVECARRGAERCGVDVCRSIIAAWLESPYRKGRRNAIVAATTLPPEDKASLLIRRAMDEEVMDVRLDAVRAIVDFDDAAIAAASGVFAQQLSGSVDSAKRAYATLGLVRINGRVIPVPGIGVRTRIRVMRASRNITPAIARRLLLGSFRVGMATSLCVLGLLYGAVEWGLGPPDSDLRSWIVADWTFAIFLAPVIALLMRPVPAHPFRVTATLFQATRALMLGAILFGVLGIASGGDTRVAAMSFVVTGSIAVARIGTALAFRDHRARLNPLMQSLAGFSIAIPFMTAGLLWTRVSHPGPLWLFFVLAIAALVGAMAGLDFYAVAGVRKPNAYRGPKGSIAAKYWPVATAGAVLSLLVVAAWRAHAPELAKTVVGSGGVPPGVHAIVTQQRARVAFTVPRRATIVAYAPVLGTTRRLETRLYDSTSRLIASGGQRAPTFEGELAAGRYELELLSHSSIRLEDVLGLFAYALTGRRVSTDLASPVVASIGVLPTDSAGESTSILERLPMTWDYNPADTSKEIFTNRQSAFDLVKQLMILGHSAAAEAVMMSSAQGLAPERQSTRRLAWVADYSAGVHREEATQEQHKDSTRYSELASRLAESGWPSCAPAIQPAHPSAAASCDWFVSTSSLHVSYVMRGILRARQGDYAKAGQDFAHFLGVRTQTGGRSILKFTVIETGVFNGERVAEWQKSVEQRSDPFTPATLQLIRDSLPSTLPAVIR